MQPSICPPFVVPLRPSGYPSTVSLQPLIRSPSATGWVYTSPGLPRLPYWRTWDSFLGLGLFLQPWVGVGSFLGLGLFPQPRVGASPKSSPKGFTFGLGLVLQPAAAPSPSSYGSLVSWSWMITPFNLRITQLGPFFNRQTVVGRCGNRILMMYLWWFTANNAGKIIGANISFLRWFGIMNDVYVHCYAHWWDRGLHLQSGVNLPMLGVQLSIYVVNRSRCELFVSFLETRVEVNDSFNLRVQ